MSCIICFMVVYMRIATTIALLLSLAATILLKTGSNCSATITKYPTRRWSAWTDLYAEEIIPYNNIMKAPRVEPININGVYVQTVNICCSLEATYSKHVLTLDVLCFNCLSLFVGFCLLGCCQHLVPDIKLVSFCLVTFYFKLNYFYYYC